jgi:hypothetical protein
VDPSGQLAWVDIQLPASLAMPLSKLKSSQAPPSPTEIDPPSDSRILVVVPTVQDASPVPPSFTVASGPASALLALEELPPVLDELLPVLEELLLELEELVLELEELLLVLVELLAADVPESDSLLLLPHPSGRSPARTSVPATPPSTPAVAIRPLFIGTPLLDPALLPHWVALGIQSQIQGGHLPIHEP